MECYKVGNTLCTPTTLFHRNAKKDVAMHYVFVIAPTSFVNYFICHNYNSLQVLLAQPELSCG